MSYNILCTKKSLPVESECVSKRETLKYDLNVIQTKKSNRPEIRYYLGPTNFDCLHNNFKKHFRANNINKKILYPIYMHLNCKFEKLVICNYFYFCKLIQFTLELIVYTIYLQTCVVSICFLIYRIFSKNRI